MHENEFLPYSQELDYTYLNGILKTHTAYKASPDSIMCLLVSGGCTVDDLFFVQSMKSKGIPAIYISAERAAALNISKSVAAVIKKKGLTKIRDDRRHLILDDIHKPSNLGAIIRTAAASGITDIAYIGSKISDFDSAEIYCDSVGLRWAVDIELFDSLESYLERFRSRMVYSFMLSDNSTMINDIGSVPPVYSLAFGNELFGLGEEYKAHGINVKIPMYNDVNSYNVNVSVGIGLYVFNQLSKCDTMAESAL